MPLSKVCRAFWFTFHSDQTGYTYLYFASSLLVSTFVSVYLVLCDNLSQSAMNPYGYLVN